MTVLWHDHLKRAVVLHFVNSKFDHLNRKIDQVAANKRLSRCTQVYTHKGTDVDVARQTSHSRVSPNRVGNLNSLIVARSLAHSVSQPPLAIDRLIGMSEVSLENCYNNNNSNRLID